MKQAKRTASTKNRKSVGGGGKKRRTPHGTRAINLTLRTFLGESARSIAQEIAKRAIDRRKARG